jgi:hypothetical protein
MNRIILFILTASSIIVSCSDQKNNELEGEWNVQWVTDPASYPDVDASINFTMNGKFNFEKSGKLTIDAYGYEGCIFSNDTLSHSLNWKINNDTLSTFNNKDLHGISYKITEQAPNKVKLQMMEDIFLHLTRD